MKRHDLDSEGHEREWAPQQEDAALAEVNHLADQIARAWQSSKSALEILEEQRRDRDLSLTGGLSDDRGP